MIAVLLLQYYYAEPPIRPHIYSHTSNVTLLDLFYLRIWPLVLNNLLTPAKLAPDLGSQGHLRRENIIIMSCLRLISTSAPSYFYLRHIQSVWAIGILSQGHMGAPLYRYTGQVGPRFGNSRSLVNCKNGAITSWLRLISTSDCFPHPH